jgi:hypothetical protein
MGFPDRIGLIRALLLLVLAMTISTASASVISVGSGAFPGGSALITFTGIPDFTEVNGLSVDGVLFAYSLGNGQVIIDGGPGVTNEIDPPNIVSIGDNTGVLTLILPAAATMFGYGYAILNDRTVPDATTITLFNGATNIGSLSFDGAPDPFFTGGFAGIQSTVHFDRVQIAFESVDAPAFALDNVRFNTAIPEPSSVALIGIGLCLISMKTRLMDGE